MPDWKSNWTTELIELAWAAVFWFSVFVSLVWLICFGLIGMIQQTNKTHLSECLRKELRANPHQFHCSQWIQRVSLRWREFGILFKERWDRRGQTWTQMIENLFYLLFAECAFSPYGGSNRKATELERLLGPEGDGVWWR